MEIRGRRTFWNQRCIKKQIRSFYINLYHQPHVPAIDFDKSLVSKISKEAKFLERMPTSKEIKNAVWEWDTSKASGYDVLNLKFIKELWVEIGDDFIKCVMDFVVTGRMPRKLNMT